MSTCSLCLQQRELEASHLIPRFVGKWIKQTSATGFLRGVERPQERLQDLPSLPLLCSDCEERFSGLETYFANEIFYPFLEKKVRCFEYDGRLQMFIISLSWRVLKATYPEVVQEAPYHTSLLDKAEANWRKFLLGQSVPIEPYENHLFFLDGKVEGEIPDNFEWYTLRAADTTLGGNEKRLFAYTKFPSMCFVTSVYPTHLDGWEGTLVELKGKISTPQVVEDEWFGRFLESRVAIISRALSGPSSELIGERVMRAVRKEPKRFLESESLKTIIVEKERISSEKGVSKASANKRKKQAEDE